MLQLNQAVEHINGLLGSLLDISRLRQGMVKSEPEPVVLNAFIARLKQEMSGHPGFAALQVIVDIPADLQVWADPVLLGRCVRNLLNNVLVHSGARCLRCSAILRADMISLVLEDDGVGIEPAQQARVFDAFYQQGPAQGLGSLGLGLAIVRQLARLMGGDCTLSSAPDKGCRFSLTLPVASLVAVPSSQVMPVDQASGCVLLIEEHAETRALQQVALQNWGYQVITAESLGQAREVLATVGVDLVMTDWNLPDGDGLCLVDELRAAGRSTPVVVLTADTSLRQQHDRQRQVWVLHKPLPPARLRVVLERLFRAEEPQAARAGVS